jgi:1,4-dihydroxy-2-naphthoate octaprenyltransferase
VASPGQWIEGARPRTLPAAVAPVLVGTGAAVFAGGAVWSRALLALVVALALQVAVNYANDYSDGIRGTDQGRVGPVRLVGQGLATPSAVRTAAVLAFAAAAAAGLALVVVTGAWWLLLVGAASIVAAWFYTGGPRPYGYAGLGEVFVFVFFGVVAVTGTTYVQVAALTATSLVCSLGVGALTCAILVANNLRDIPGDFVAGKRTLAVRLGDPGTRLLYQGLVAAGLLVPAALGVAGLAGLGGAGHWPRGALVALLAGLAALGPLRVVRSGAVGRDLVAVLAGTGRLLLVYGVLLGVGVALSH